MATFLTTSKMAPALVARIEASVRGRRTGPVRTLVTPRVIAGFRLALIAAFLAVATVLVVSHRQGGQAIERERTALLDELRTVRASVTPEDEGSLARAESWVQRFASTYEGDFVADELRTPHAIADALGRPSVYIRGSLAAFASAASVAEAVSASIKDSLVLCLLEAPTSRAEKALLGKVRASYADGAFVQQRTANVFRLEDADLALRVLLPAWTEEVRAAPDLRALGILGRELEHAPVARARQAARAGMLVLAIDEPAEAGGPADLDGERAHQVRVGLVDVASVKVLLRIRRRVDPSAWSSGARSVYARGLDGCALAFDVHESASH